MIKLRSNAEIRRDQHRQARKRRWAKRLEALKENLILVAALTVLFFGLMSAVLLFVLHGFAQALAKWMSAF